MNKKRIGIVVVAVLLMGVTSMPLAIAQQNDTKTSNMTATPTETPTATPTVTPTETPTNTVTATPTKTEKPDSDSEEGIVSEEPVNASESIETIGCISQRCTLKVIEYDIQDNGLATIKLLSTTNQPVTLTSMDFRDGFRQLNQKKDIQVSEGIVTLQIYVDNSQRKMGFTTANPHGISQFKVSKGGFSFDGVYSGNQMLFFGSFGFIGGVLVVGAATYRRQLKLNGEVKQEL